MSLEMQSPFDEDYFMRGPETGKSNYVNYHWMEERTMAFAESLKAYWDARKAESFLDFGCARGYTVKAMRRLGLCGYGFDISDWAIENCDEEVKPYVSQQFIMPSYDFVLAKDVLEHVPLADIEATIDRLVNATRRKLLIIVPLASERTGAYVREEDNKDSTHLICWPLHGWLMTVSSSCDPEKHVVSASWHIPGLKPTSTKPFKSCGFISVDVVRG